jgi:uncharacterized integral membrane protein
MVTIIILLLVLFIVAIFSVQNALPVAITFFFWQFQASLAIVVFLSALCGMIAGAIIISLVKFRPPVREKDKVI